MAVTQNIRHALRIVFVHLAAVGFDKEFFGLVGHGYICAQRKNGRALYSLRAPYSQQ
jgi:hypothetical protein